MSIAENLHNIKKTLPEHVTLVAVSKTKSVDEIMEAYNAGQRIFGENKIQEMTEKWQQLPKDIQWHMIGHVQTNKVKYMASYVSLIHGVDSLKLLKEINKQAQKHNRVIDCLLQIHIAEEETKFGLDENELDEMLKQLLDCARSDSNEFQNIRIIGLMGMATFTDNPEQIKKEFQYLKRIYDELRRKTEDERWLSGVEATITRNQKPVRSSGVEATITRNQKPETRNQKPETRNPKPETLSMGMSGDYQIAIEQGSTMIRIGSSIFGGRN